MYKICENFEAGVYLNGKEFPLEAGNFMPLLHIMASTKVTLPVLHLQLVDTLEIIPQYGLTDGSPIVIVIKSSVTITRNFRVYKWSRNPHGNGFAYTIDAYYDAPKYWGQTTLAGIRGSSYQALQQIAAATDLQFWKNNTATSDNMLWMPGNKTYGQFARAVARHGYLNDQSHLVLGVDTQGFMRYLDVNSLPEPDISVGYLDPNDGSPFVTCIDFQVQTASGMANFLGGYRHQRHTQSVVAEDEVESDLSFTSDSKQPLLNTEIRDAYERGTVSYSPIDCGNVHDKYERGLYQNMRYNLLKSMEVEVMFPIQTPFEPLDKFNYVAPAAQSNTDYNGGYTVAAKAIMIAGAAYYEKVVSVRNGVNGK